MAILFTNIKSLVNVRKANNLLRGEELAVLPCIDNAYLIVEGENITEYGKMKKLKFHPKDFAFHMDIKDRMILPAWCDSHTHLVFAGSRENEFVDRLKGLSYAEIAAKGGGILYTARKVNHLSENELFNLAITRLKEVMKSGTGAIEIKSGYGLNLKSELKLLRVIKRLKNAVKIPIKATFLGAHAIPEKYADHRQAYINMIIDEMLPVISLENLADYVDVFCEKGFFTVSETESICIAARQFGMKAKIHGNQLHCSGGVEVAVKLGAISVDHLESVDDAAIHNLGSSSTIGTLLPSAAFFLKLPFAPARRLIENNVALALASDYNPGSSPSGNMNFVVSLSCIQMQMLPEEAINAATINGAFAMEVQDLVGSISIGKKANLIITRQIPSLSFIPYSFGNNLVDKVMLYGEWL